MKDLIIRLYNTGKAYLAIMLPFLLLSGVVATIISWMEIAKNKGIQIINAYINYDVHWLTFLFLWGKNVLVLLLLVSLSVNTIKEDLKINRLRLTLYTLLSYIILITPITLILMAVILIFCYLAGIVLDKTELWEVLMYSFLIRNVYGVLWTVWRQECGKLKTVDE